jgi:hypothetical protein
MYGVENTVAEYERVKSGGRNKLLNEVLIISGEEMGALRNTLRKN